MRPALKEAIHRIVDRRIGLQVPRGVTEPLRGTVTEVDASTRRAMVRIGKGARPVPVPYPALPVSLTADDEVVIHRGRDGWYLLTEVLGRDPVPPEAAGTVAGSLPVIVVRALGGTGDDAPNIRAAVAAAEPGTTILMPDPLYNLKSSSDGVCVDIAGKYNVTFVGRGADKANAGVPDITGVTTTIRCQAPGSPVMLRWRPTIANATDNTSETYGGGMRGISINGNATASVCVELQGGSNRITFEDCWIGAATQHAVLAGQGNDSVGTIQGWHSTYQITFDRCNFRQYTGAGTSMIYLDGNQNAAGGEHSYNFHFRDCGFTYSQGSTAVVAVATDDIFFLGCGFATSVPSDPNTYSIRFEGSTDQQVSDSVIMFGCYGANLPHMKVEGTGYNRAGRGHMVLPMVLTDSVARPEWEEGGQIWYYDTLGRHNLRYDLRTSMEIVDEFMGGVQVAAGGTGGSGVGDLNWVATLGAAGSVTYLDGPGGHPGVRRLATGAGASAALLSLQNSATLRQVVLDGYTFFAVFIFRLNLNDANTNVRIGFAANATGNPPSSGLYIEKLAGESSWFAVNRVGGVQTGTRTNIGSVSAGTGAGDWETLTIWRRYAGAVGFTLDSMNTYAATTQATHTANEPGGAMSPFFWVQNAGSVNTGLDIDAFQLHMQGLPR